MPAEVVIYRNMLDGMPVGASSGETYEKRNPWRSSHVVLGGIQGLGWEPHGQGRTALEFYTGVVTVYEDT